MHIVHAQNVNHLKAPHKHGVAPNTPLNLPSRVSAPPDAHDDEVNVEPYIFII